MPTRINFRNDSPLYAEARAGATSEKWREWYADDPTSRDEMLATPDAEPSERIKLALQITEKLYNGVRAPFDILEA